MDTPLFLPNLGGYGVGDDNDHKLILSYTDTPAYPFVEAKHFEGIRRICL